MIAGRESGFGAASLVTTPHTHQPAHAEDEASQPETGDADSQPDGEERGLKAVGENLQRIGERIQAAIAEGELSEEEGWAKWHDVKEETINGAVAAGTISGEEAGVLWREIEKGEAAARLKMADEEGALTEKDARTKWAEISEEVEDEEQQNSRDYGAGLPGLLMSLLRSREFESFEELRTAIEQSFGEPGIHEAAQDLAEVMGLKPSVLASALTEDCIERGIAREKGGARYNTRAGGLLFASPDFANSLAAVKKLVFEKKKITMDELLEAVDNNFEGYEDIRKMCLDAPKFGNDDDYVDELLAWITHLACEPGRKCKTIYGGRRYPSLIPLAYSVSAGREMGALPSGRLAGEPLSDGVSPTPGSDFNGPTSVLKSVGKVNNAEVGLGQALNIKLDPAVFGTVDGFGRFAALVRVFVDQKVDHVQFNVVSSDTLKAAQKEPEKYLELTVKVAGYNARFVRLYKEIQDSIIAKTEHRGF
jgi:pyruvate-formate lyase